MVLCKAAGGEGAYVRMGVAVWMGMYSMDGMAVDDCECVGRLHTSWMCVYLSCAHCYCG